MGAVAQTWNFVGGIFHYTLVDYVMWALESNPQVNEEIAWSALSGFLAITGCESKKDTGCSVSFLIR